MFIIKSRCLAVLDNDMARKDIHKLPVLFADKLSSDGFRIQSREW